MPSNEVKLARHVFTVSGYPRNSYVSRGDYENRIFNCLDNPHPLSIQIIGPSKTGKSSLLKSCLLKLPKQKQIWIYGNYIKTIDDFWDVLANNLGVIETQYVIGTGDSLPVKVERSRISKVTIKRITDEIKKQQPLLIIEDFHWIPNAIRPELNQTIKTLLEETELPKKGLKVIMLLVSSKSTRDPIVWHNLMGRSEIIDVPLWDSSDLALIASQHYSNEAALVGLTNVTAECYGLPYIMQKVCYEYLNKFYGGVINPTAMVYLFPEGVMEILSMISSSLWAQGIGQFYEYMISDNSTKYDNDYIRNDGKKGNLRKIILDAITKKEIYAHDGIRIDNQITFPIDKIYRSVINSLSEESRNILQSDIEECLIEISLKADIKYKELIEILTDPFDPLLEYMSISKELVIYDPSFLISLRHSEEHQRYFK